MTSRNGRDRQAATDPGGAELRELRVLDGPNLYFTRPAIKLTIDAPGWFLTDERRALALAERVELPGATDPPGRIRPGPPGSGQRPRFVARAAAHLTRRLASATGRGLAVRARPGTEPCQVIVAYPWLRRSAAEAFGNQVVAIMDAAATSRRSVPRAIEDAARRLRDVDPGPAPSVPDPTIPTVAVTGTNGKTTTVRLLAHLVREAGRNVAYSSTDGVYFQERLVEAGDYSGFGGAARALAQPGVDVAVLETARGGILLRGIGTLHNDVAVVTNISADHLGLHGIHTLDQLAEVKSTILRITRPGGWAVLNADDPRVLAMRRVARGRPWMISLDPDHPALRSAVAEGGRGFTVIDGRLALLAPGSDPRPLIDLRDVPVTLAGLSSANVSNAMGAAAAALGIGLPENAVVRGLRTFVLDPDRNPGRTNLFELDGRIIVVDYAHNEAGMRGLVEVCRGLCPAGRQVWLTFAAAGDRTDEIVHALGFTAARAADHVAVAELLRYLRGRDRDELVKRLVAGAEDGGATEVPVHPDEMHALTWMLASSKPGDVVAVTALAQRPEIFAMLEEHGARRVGPARLRRIAARGRQGS
ncbi:MAG TPA: Mur ligase family protein [Actinomycetota bacterium]|jgi:cyanophycin synthetase